MNEPISNNPDERGLLPYPVILAATKGDPEAMKIVVQHYASYIAYLEAYLRKMAIDGYIIQIDHADIKAMTAEIQKIGVNVNQIAKRVNATGSVYQEDIEEIKEVLAEIWRLQRLSLLKAR